MFSVDAYGKMVFLPHSAPSYMISKGEAEEKVIDYLHSSVLTGCSELTGKGGEWRNSKIKSTKAQGENE